MSTSSVLNRWLNRFYKLVAILLVLFAVLISSVRALLPYAENYRHALQDYINETYQTDVIIGALNFDWQQSGPSLVAQNISLLDTDGVAVNVERLFLSIDFWQSLRKQALVTRDFSIDGAQVLLTGDVLAQEQPAAGASELEVLDNLANLFLNRFQYINISNSELTLQLTEQEHHFIIEHLILRNEKQRHQASGTVSLAGLQHSNMVLLVDVSGVSYRDLAGQIYLKGDNLDLSDWIVQSLPTTIEQVSSQVNFDAWLTIQSGQAKRLQVAFGDNQLQWSQAGANHTFSLPGGQIIAEQQGFKRLSLYSSPLIFANEKHAWLPWQFNLNANQSGWQGNLENLDLAVISFVAPLFLPEQLSAQLQQSDITGRVSELYFNLSNDNQGSLAQNLKLVADIEQFSSQSNGAIPGVEGMSMALTYTDQRALIELAGEYSSVDFGSNLPRAVPYNQLLSELSVDFADDVEIAINQLVLSSDELNFVADGQLLLAGQRSPYLALNGLLTDLDVSTLGNYFPEQLMGQDLVSYLNNSIVSGTLARAQVLFNGQLNQFPFAEQQGVFTVDAELEDAVFKFSPSWPAIQQFNANLNFTNASMLITGRSGSLTGLDVTGVTAAIKDLSNESLLEVNANFKELAPVYVKNLMLGSPLANSVGEVLTQLTIEKPIDGFFSLDLPLNKVSDAVAKGQVNLVDNALTLASPAMSFSEVNGQLTFDNETIRLASADIMWQGLPLEISVHGDQQQDFYQTDIALNAKWPQSQWQYHLPEPIKPYLQGRLDWQGKLSLFMPNGGGFSYQLDIESDLNAADLLLPEPYRKPLEQVESFTVSVDGQLNDSEINLTYGQQLSFHGILSHKKKQFSRAHLVLGNDTMMLPMDGFHITTELAAAEFSQWQPFVTDIIESTTALSQSDGEGVPLLAKPERIRGGIEQLTIFNQKLNGVSFNLLDQEHWWLLQLNAKEARSQVTFYPDLRKQGVAINVDFLQLPKNEKNTSELSSTPPSPLLQPRKLTSVEAEAHYRKNSEFFANTPPIKFDCASCKIGDLDLGKVHFDLAWQGNDKLVINDFKAERDGFLFTMAGSWQHDGQSVSKTDVSGRLQIASVEHEFSKFDYASIIKDSGGELNYQLSWPGGPQDFNLIDATGTFQTELDDGYLADVSDKGARLFSVLSLQSLVRKLTFDFRDIFSDGMFYSKISSDFTLKNGVIYTDNTEMKGAAGDLLILGNTDLAAGQLDYKMSYKPNLTSSLPVLAWIATLNPVTFIAGMAIDEVVTSKVVSEFRFELTGSISEPNLREVDRKSQNISVGRSKPPEIVDNNSETDSGQIPSSELPIKDGEHDGI